MRKWTVWVCLGLTVWAYGAYAQEWSGAWAAMPSVESLDAAAQTVAKEAPPEALPTAASGLWGFLLAAGGIIAGVAGWLWARVRERLHETKAAKAAQFIEVAAHEYQTTYDRAIEHARTDGVVTNDEVREAVRLGVARAVAVAKANGVDLAKYYALEYLPVLFEKLFRAKSPLAGSPR